MQGLSVTRDADDVRRHFHKTAHKFDAIYSGNKSFIGRFLDGRLRWDMQERLEMTLAACQPIEGKSVLDIGCGTGRFCFPLAEGGASKIVGIDFAAAMIAAARRLAEERNHGEKCTFECVDFLDFPEEDKYDYVIAVGLFDYVADGRRIMQKMRTLTEGKAIMTFPRTDTWRAPIRKIRLGILGCPVYFYTEKRIRDHLMIAGFSVTALRRVGKLFFVEAE